VPPPWEDPNYQYGQYQPPGQPYPPASGYPPPGYPPPGYPPPGYPPAPGYPPQYPGYSGMPPAWQPSVDVDAPTPGVIPLRRSGLDTGDIVGGVVAAYRRDWRTLLGLSALVNGVATVVTFALALLGVIWLLPGIQAINEWDSVTGPTESQIRAFISDVLLPGLPLIALILVISVIARTLLHALVAVVLAEDAVANRIGIGTAFQAVRPVLGRLVAQSLLVAVCLAIGALPCLIPAVWLLGIWAVATPALVLERTTATGSLGRSQSLVRGMYWRVLGIRLLGMIGGGVLSYVIALPFNVYNPTRNVEVPSMSQVVAWLVVLLIGQFVASVLTGPVGPSVEALLYLDARMRKEGLAEHMRQGFAPRANP